MRKLPVKGREFVFQQFKQGESNQNILEQLKKKFGVQVSGAYISQLRQIQTIQDMTFMNKDVEKKVKEKIKIDANVLSIARGITDEADKWLRKNRDEIQNMSAKEISMVLTAFHKFFREYREMSGGTQRSETVHTKILALDKKAEMGE